MTKKTKLKTTFISFLLDESGSMASIKDDTIGGFNNYIETIRKHNDGAGTLFSFVKFDSNGIRKVCVGEPINNVDKLNDQTYIPGAATPLIDACVKMIRATEKAIEGRDDDPSVLVVIQTDGYENASTEFTREDLQRLIKEKTDAGWAFMYIGAGIDAYADAGSFGFSPQSTMAYASDKSENAFASVANASVAYMASGGSAQAASFSVMDKRRAGDKFIRAHPKHPTHPKHPSPTTGSTSPPTASRTDTDDKKDSLVGDFSL